MQFMFCIYFMFLRFAAISGNTNSPVSSTQLKPPWNCKPTRQCVFLGNACSRVIRPHYCGTLVSLQGRTVSWSATASVDREDGLLGG